MTVNVLCLWDGVGWRLRRQPTPSHNKDIVMICHSERSEESNIFYRTTMNKIAKQNFSPYEYMASKVEAGSKKGNSRDIFVALNTTRYFVLLVLVYTGLAAQRCFQFITSRKRECPFFWTLSYLHLATPCFAANAEVPEERNYCRIISCVLFAIQNS